MPNRLIHETSPYLLQHANNPVDWYPWGAEALERAHSEHKPILLSIGYSACHWCHVMERESFEDADTAQVMNERFVNIKVDREERPDLDGIYMTAVQALTGRGGWPMTMFLTPEGLPFYGGTYFPPEDHGQMPSFRRVLVSVSDAYHTRPEDVQKNAQHLVQTVNRSLLAAAEPTLLTADSLDGAFQELTAQYDATAGGFGSAPKFPQPMSLEFLLRYALRTRNDQALSIVTHTLVNMARGGIYDHLGGGFHRYSTDGFWLVPHFEKMLYDNALLSQLYLHTFQITGDPFFRRIATETLDYVQREMTGLEGGFYSTLDADSEGEEGKFYVWSLAELQHILGADADVVARYYGVSAGGNFEGHNIFNIPEEPEQVAQQLGMALPELEAVVGRGRRALLEVRSSRVWPALDDKALTAWNGLMLRSFAEAGAALGRADYLATAVRNAEFVLSTLQQDERLLRSYRNGQAKLNGYLEDYAFYADGLLALYEATFEARWLNAAVRLTETMLERFRDDGEGGFFDTAADHETLFSRPKDVTDNATPAGNSVATALLIRLARLLGRPEYEERAAALLRKLAGFMRQHPMAFGHQLGALDLYLAPPQEVAVVGIPDQTATKELLEVVWNNYLPNTVAALFDPTSPDTAIASPLLEGRGLIDGKPAAYVCQHFTCNLPVTTPQALEQQLGLG